MIGENASPLGWLEVLAWIALVGLALWGVAQLIAWWFDFQRSHANRNLESEAHSSSKTESEVLETSNQSWREKPWRR